MGEVGLKLVLSSTSLPSKDFCQALPSDLFTVCTCRHVSCYWSTNCPSETPQSSVLLSLTAQPHTSEAMSQTSRVARFAQFSDFQLGNSEVGSARFKLKAARQTRQCLRDCYTPSVGGKKFLIAERGSTASGSGRTQEAETCSERV